MRWKSFIHALFAYAGTSSASFDNVNPSHDSQEPLRLSLVTTDTQADVKTLDRSGPGAPRSTDESSLFPRDLVPNKRDPVSENVEDPDFEEKLRNGSLDINQVPSYLLQVDDDGHPMMTTPSSRALSTNSAKIGTFERLGCNPSIWSSCDTLVSDKFPTAGNPLIIPCGECYTFDVSGNVTIAGGIHIKGKLLFPTNHHAVISTPFVVVQGDLEITANHAQIRPEHMATRFILTGTEDVMFTPIDAPNQNACDLQPNKQCNLGPKPFLIAGGKVNINGMPESCATHTPIVKKIYKDPIYDPEDFPKLVSLPSTCPVSGINYISYDFENGYGNWTGRDGSFVDSANGAVTITNRKLKNRGPYLDITPIRPELCLVPNQEYLFVSRLKLDMGNGTMHGEDTTCRKYGQNCPAFFMIHHDTQYERSDGKAYLHQHVAPKYGDYFDLTGTITFTEDELSPSNYYFTMLVGGPDVGVDITIDSFDLFLPSQSSYPNPNALCDELVFNGNAEDNGFNPYPMVAYRYNERLKIVEDDGNKFWRLFNRNNHRSSVKYQLDTNCLTRGVTYTISSKVRYHLSEGFVGGSEPYYWYINFKRASDNVWVDQYIVNCDAQSVDDNWVSCSGEFMIDEDLSETSEAYLLMGLNNNRDGHKYDLDFDDISIRYHKGYVSELVVDSGDVSCWGDGADVHVTSATYYSWAKEKSNGFLSQIKSLAENSDGTANLQLNVAPTLPIISEEDNKDHAVEIVLISRNIQVDGDDDEYQKGGYMQVLHTPDIAQIIQGVEFGNMGRRSEVDRFALQFLYSGTLDGTLISRNSFRQSNQRCIAIEGTSNVTISHNIGYQTNGHCIYIGYQSKFNFIVNNLVSDTRHISWNHRIAHETDYHPAAFLNWYSPNDFTNNIAVAGERHGFVFENNYRTRLEDTSWINESVRNIRMGLFTNNIAKSNGDIGMYFPHHESGEEISLTNVKAIKNRYRGLYLYSSYNVTLKDSLFADNTQFNIEMRWVDNVNIRDTVIRGYTTETMVLVKPPYFNKPCISSFYPPVGLKIPTAIHKWDRTDNVGATLTNILFTDFDHSNECAKSVPITFSPNDNVNNHHDYLTMFQNVTINGTQIMDVLSSDQEGVKDIIINDIDGSSDPSGQVSSSGVFVSNMKWLKTFAGADCIKYPSGISYCGETCYRTISFLVDQFDSADVDLQVTRETDGKVTIIPYTYKYDDNLHLKGYSDYSRFFSVSLPAGSYKAEFLKNLQPTWPNFVLPRWEGIPECEGYVSPANLTIVEPPSVCDDLIVNGDMEQGTFNWFHRNSNSDTKYGALLAVEGEGVNNSTALRHYNRTNGYAGIGQNLDTRCLHQSLHDFYEIQLYFRLENKTTAVICDPFSSSWEVRCPYITFRQQKYVDEKLQSTYVGGRANVIVPNDLGDLNLIHGVFKVDESIHSLQRLFMYLEVAHKDFDMIMDNVSVKKLPGSCGKDLVRNGDFEENGKFWRRYGKNLMDIDTSSGKTLKIFNKERPDDGVFQDLYIDKDCFQENDRFKITGKFKIESASNGTKYTCDRSVRDGELECSYLNLWSSSPIGYENTFSAETVASAQGDQEWSILAGILTINEKQAAHDRMYIRLYGPHTNMTLFYDDISIIPIPKSCANLVTNGDFEVGDSRFWRPSDRRYIDVDISSLGAGESEHSLMIQKYTSNRIYQNLDTRCLVEGQEFQINAKFRLLNATDLASGVECQPTMLNVGDSRHCPTVTVRGSACNGNNFDYVFWNEIAQFQWNPNDFNDYEKAFTITPELASCEAITIELGRWVHNGRVLLVDDIQVNQRTTSPPTPFPTFSPTKAKYTGPTSQPSVKTDAPTTTNILTCPSIGETPLVVNSGTIMLQVADTTLCTLTKVVSSSSTGEITSIPIARSYGNDPWEKAAGEYAASLFLNRDVLCYTAGCQIHLPELEAGSEYHLSTFSLSSSDSNEYARFLETATFGITQEQLDAFDLSSHSVQTNIVAWISNQMNRSITPMSSHREYWRKGVNARLPTSTSMGTADHPCDSHSRWRKISFIRNDNQWSINKNLRVIGSGPFVLELNGWTRTTVQNFTIDHSDYINYVFDSTFDYELCGTPEEKIDGRLYIRVQTGECVAAQNPAINLDGLESSIPNIFNLPDNSFQPSDQWWNNGESLVFVLQNSLFDNPLFSTTCAELPSVPEIGDAPIFGKLSDGTWLMFDPRLDINTNTPSSPIADGGKQSFLASGGDTYCSNVPRTFLNENECQLSSEACKPSSTGQIEILLDNSTIATLNNLTGRYVYAIKGLLVKYKTLLLEHPCTPGLRSRWEPKNLTDCQPTELYDTTNSSLFDLLSQSTDQNPYMRDIHFPDEGKECDMGDTEPEIEIEVNGQCWRRVHDDHMSLFDMTYWVDNHPGGPDKITKWSQNNGTYLIYPSLLQGNPHGMSRWNNNWHKFPYVGRFGDSLRLGDLTNDLRKVEVTNYFGDSDESDNSQVLVCGSPGEISNLKNQEFLFDANTGFVTNGLYTGNNRKYVWIMIALGASDQLRQRVAWAFSQILVVVKNAIGSEYGNSEMFLSYYDIFVRNAFGNYRDVLREVSYNPLMAENLSFLGSKSSAYMLERYRIKTSADENFAREIMQLFTMGLVQLNMDGSPKVGIDGERLLAYTNDDIMSFSRAWTGFDLQLRRGNMEGRDNRIDPMRINPEWRDRFPKSHTNGGYIGDDYPLCSDFPSKSFLMEGATYRFLGSSSLPELMSDPAGFEIEDTLTRLSLEESSPLRQLLCNEENGNCIYENTVTLPTTYNCTGIECNLDTIRVVQVAPNAYYEFVHPPCVNFAFYNNPVKISPRYSTDKVMCADPGIPVASEACCSIGNNRAARNSKYSGERVLFTTAQARCTEVSKEICDFYSVDGEYYLNTGYFWTADSCLLRVKVKRDGMVAIVHQPSDFLERVAHVSEDNTNYFKVFWDRDRSYPTVENDCDGACLVLPEGACLCNTRVIDTVVFDNMPLSKSEAMEKLHIGAINPQTFDSGTYSTITDAETNITAHLKNDEFNLETIFEYVDEKGRRFFMKNSRSSVYLSGITSGNTGQAFRNTPQFMSFIPSETTLRDAQYETEATLDHYFYHDNTPPFLASRLIQRLIISNPSPRYIQTVANAFTIGTYTVGGVSFGTGKYGDLASTFAAIYLDSAARNVVLDDDITSGTLREPIVKVLALMKSMEFASQLPVTGMNGMVDDIGQMAHEFTSVFSFFLPEFKPYGRVGDAKLVSPEATLLDMPKIIGLMNGLTSLVKYGLSSCEGGWGYQSCRERRYISSPLGTLGFNKTSEIPEFSFETFEGPSLIGGLDNKWVGRDFNSHNGKATLDPLVADNHVLHFPTAYWNGDFFSQSVQNKDSSSNPYVVKFKYLSLDSSGNGCIGYVDAARTYLNTQTWSLCDRDMGSNGDWVSCQFVVPSDVETFRIVVGDRRDPGGNAYFDDIQIASGNETSCSGIHVPRNSPPGQTGYSNAVVDKLSTLLTAGRLSANAKALIVDAYDDAGSAEDGLHMAQQLILTTAEFHTTNAAKSTDQPREDVSFPPSTGKPYRAVVYLMLSGGCDSFNMLTPYTCSNGLYESYLDVRQQVALAKNRLLPIAASDQVCSEFGLHPELSAIKDLYNEEDLLFFANTGVLSQPVNKDNYYILTNTQLFAHNHMQRETKRVDPYETSSGTGVLGRMTDVLSREGHNTGSFSVDRFSVALVGKPGISDAPMIVDRRGVPQVYLDDTKDALSRLHNITDANRGVLADTWSSSLMKSIGTNELLSDELQDLTTQVTFPDTYLAQTLETVSRLIATRDVRGVDVDTFYIETGGFDTHADVEEALNNRFSEINDAFAAFSQEMKLMNVWNNVTLIQTSDFARTLNPNGGDGTDHAWGGNYMMMGGSVKGGRILGEYPEDITDEGPLTLGRGRMIPTTPWEAPFRGIAAWLGINQHMDEVCPNLYKFDSSYLIDVDKMFGGVEQPFTPNPTPSSILTEEPSTAFSSTPSTSHQSSLPSMAPSTTQSVSPSSLSKDDKTPSDMPSNIPSVTLSTLPSQTSLAPSGSSSIVPSAISSTDPSSVSSDTPSSMLSTRPSLRKSLAPSSVPSNTLSIHPSSVSSGTPSSMLSTLPSLRKSLAPSSLPSNTLSVHPSQKLSLEPSSAPSLTPSTTPSLTLSVPPSTEPSLVSSEPTPAEASTSSPTLVPSKKVSSAAPSVESSVVPTVSPLCSMPCNGDSSNRFQVVGLNGKKSCRILNNPQRKAELCLYPEMSLNCCASCCP